jgi:hypothetical protein
MEPLTMIGGMGAAGGVGLMNQGAGAAGCTGLCQVWGRLNGRHYPAGSGLNLFPDMYVAEQSFWAMLNGSESVTTAPGCRLVSVGKAGACLTQAQFLCAEDTQPVTVLASVFIDASYDGAWTP